ncbi:AEC family transporter [uncultured Pseudoramibacter sp.]|uniref:AEC family transporter n=1 Tax=uncultured Pseudoramibacter sp. TaxID=1623493 RepID=UPI0025E19E58|nr:AEC family transporter [uncultured Pseudoramibacter sp.]
MYTVIIKAIGFVVIIALGYFSQKFGIVTKEDGKIFGKVIMTFTLPCSLIYGFSGVHFNMLMLFALVIGFTMSTIGLILGDIVSGKSAKLARGNNMLCCSGYNIGNFAIPFSQSFFPLAATSYLGMFDIGNCIMCLGGDLAIVESKISDGSCLNFIEILRKLYHSIPFMVYVVLMILSIVEMAVPKPIYDIVSLIAPANIFLIMFMIGTQIEFDGLSTVLRPVMRIFAVRIAIAIGFIVVIQFMPLPQDYQRIMTIAVLSPIASPTMIYAEELGCDLKVTAAASTLSMLLSIIAYVIYMITVL